MKPLKLQNQDIAKELKDVKKKLKSELNKGKPDASKTKKLIDEEAGLKKKMIGTIAKASAVSVGGAAALSALQMLTEESEYDNIDKYNLIFEKLQEKYEAGEITLEQAEAVNNMAYEKYVVDNIIEEEVNDLIKNLQNNVE